MENNRSKKITTIIGVYFFLARHDVKREGHKIFIDGKQVLRKDLGDIIYYENLSNGFEWYHFNRLTYNLMKQLISQVTPNSCHYAIIKPNSLRTSAT